MGLIGDLLAGLAQFAVGVLEATGYLGLFLLMAAESMVLPVPSEAVMPFAGYMASDAYRAAHPGGGFLLPMAILASSAGSLAGSYLGYWMGQFGLLPLVRRYGKYVLVHDHHVTAAERWFQRRGGWAVFLCRFVPGVRHVVSIPAGAVRMRHGPFVAATLVGATLWNALLLWVGYAYGAAAAEALKPYLDVAGIALLALVAAYVAYEVWRGRRDRATGEREKGREMERMGRGGEGPPGPG